ncbi:hypothetical protein PL263_09755 [Methylomonas sp. EFPC3]|uniref:hypothetical protein n=1 Tax=Methylomonas sp. EFPC3 TaxID=3021710 RepID=UPI00241772E6|nr:hypothetical protein [Methylomonas sp. EFPC3]WFP52292.1 hypothetical protein PL263_09755 [Methylomonas sp. EFPC3]
MFLYELFFSVTTGFMGSLLVVLFLYRLKPKLDISPYIAEQPTHDSTPMFGFKIINRTPYPLVDIRIELVLVTPVNVNGGAVKSATALQLTRNDFFQLGKFDANDREADYALRVGCSQDIRSLWLSDTQDLRINVIARHSLSGFCAVKSYIFHTKADIKPGKHVFGNSLKVEPVD